MAYSVLIVDDDDKIVQLLQSYFISDNFSVFVASNGATALQLILQHCPDIIILDLMLPQLSGWDLCRQLRQNSNNVPIIMLTARSDETDRLIGLELGADDYVSKPFSPREVVARARAVLRRSQISIAPPEIITAGLLQIDINSHIVLLANQTIELTPSEFKILCLLAQNPGRVFSRLQIVEQVQGYAFDGYERTIDAHIKNLRRKLGDNPRQPQYLLTVYGVGYKWSSDNND